MFYKRDNCYLVTDTIFVLFLYDIIFVYQEVRNIGFIENVLVFFKATCHANARAEINFAGLSLYISRHIFRKFSMFQKSNEI